MRRVLKERRIKMVDGKKFIDDCCIIESTVEVDSVYAFESVRIREVDSTVDIADWSPLNGLRILDSNIQIPDRLLEDFPRAWRDQKGVRTTVRKRGVQLLVYKVAEGFLRIVLGGRNIATWELQGGLVSQDPNLICKLVVKQLVDIWLSREGTGIIEVPYSCIKDLIEKGELLKNEEVEEPVL